MQEIIEIIVKDWIKRTATNYYQSMDAKVKDFEKLGK